MTKSEHSPTWIAPSFTAEQWKALELDEPTSRDWISAIQIFEERIYERFIAPVDYLIAAEETVPSINRRFGFTILAIDCLLIEMLQSFRDGLENTNGKSTATFCKFLTSRSLFKADFTTYALAEKFYHEFRCGILHQAEVGGSSKVWSVGPLFQFVDDKIIVNRNKFHECLKAEFQNYIAELRDVTKAELRANFRKKMNFISRH